jgi:hypothetical protein
MFIHVYPCFFGKTPRGGTGLMVGCKHIMDSVHGLSGVQQSVDLSTYPFVVELYIFGEIICSRGRAGFTMGVVQFFEGVARRIFCAPNGIRIFYVMGF